VLVPLALLLSSLSLATCYVVKVSCDMVTLHMAWYINIIGYMVYYNKYGIWYLVSRSPPLWSVFFAISIARFRGGGIR